MKKINKLFCMAIIALVGLFTVVPVNANSGLVYETTEGINYIELSWSQANPDGNIKEYNIYRTPLEEDESEEERILIDTSEASVGTNCTYTYQIEGLKQNTQYSIFIETVFQNDTSVMSEEINATTLGIRLDATAISGNEVSLYWDYNTNTAQEEVDHYDIYVKYFDDNDEEITKSIASNVGPDENIYDVNNLEANYDYWFYVVATLENGDEIQSDDSFVSTEEGIALTFVEIGKTEAYFSWTYDKSYYGSLKNFKIFQYDDSLNDWTQIGEITNGSDYRANNIKYNDGTWQFKITATDPYGGSVSGETGIQKSPQFGLTGEFIEGNKLKLSWDYNGEYGAASSYKIYEPNHEHYDDNPVATVTGNSYIVEDIKENEKYVFSVYPVVPGDKIVRSNNLHILKNSTIDVSGINDVEYDGSSKDMNISIEYDESEQFANAGESNSSLPSNDIRMPLEENNDYSVEYDDNTDAGTAKVTIKGKGAFAGTVTKTFKINPKNITSGVSISGISNKTYNGKAQTQKLLLKYNNNTLVEGKDYNVVYTNNKNAGTAMVTIVGINNYTGKVTKTFKINKANNPLAVTTKLKSVKYTKVKKKKQVVAPITVTKKQGTVTFIKQKGSSTKLSINKTTGKITVKKGTKKGTYKIKVKINASGNINYKAKYLIKTIKVRVK